MEKLCRERMALVNTVHYLIIFSYDRVFNHKYYNVDNNNNINNINYNINNNSRSFFDNWYRN